jgi:Ca-activated chloride channel family protein
VRFNHAVLLLLALLIPLLFRWWIKQSRPASVKYSLPIPREVASSNPLRPVIILRSLGLLFLIIALARPQSSFQQIERNTSGLDIMMVLDVSLSMNIEDLAERPRIDIAKDTMEDFISGRGSDRIGFIMFSGEAMTLAPPTLDYALLVRSLHQASTGILKDGTAIGDGLSMAVNHLRNSQAKSKVVVLLTDGENNVGQVDPATAGELAAGYGIRVYTIAIGREGRVRVPVKHKDLFGNVVTAYQYYDNALNPELLQLIARTTNGKFYRVTDESTLESVFKEIDLLEKSDVKAKEKVRYDEKYPLPLKLGLLFLFAELLFFRLGRRILP